MKSYEDYVQPPGNFLEQSDNSLISKLRLRIEKDLNQINGVYDNQILEAEQEKLNTTKQIELEYKTSTIYINKQRKKDIEKYHEKAEKHIDNIISNMNNSPQQNISWWKNIFT
jgi:hypothetical protein